MVSSSRSAVVIGGGVTGAYTAYRLQASGVRTTLVEARGLGAGSSSRSAAAARQQFTTEGTVTGMRHAVRELLDLEHQVSALRKSPTRVLQQNGYLFLKDSSQWEGAKRLVQAQQGWGLKEVEALSLAEVKKRFPHVDPADEIVAGATWCPTDGLLYPDAIYQGAAELAASLGAMIRQNEPVIKSEHSNGRLTAIFTSLAKYEADIFIDATNAWSPRMGRILGGTDLPILPLRRHLWIANRGPTISEEDLAKLPMVIAPSGAYARMEANGAQIVFSKLPKQTIPEPNFGHDAQDNVAQAFDARTVDFDSVPPHPLVEAWLDLAAVMSFLNEFPMLRAVTTSGMYGTTPDHNPFLDFDPNVANLIRLAGFSGHGVMMAPLTALIASALAEAGRSLDSLALPNSGGTVPLGVFRIGREFESHEGLVI